MTTQLREVELSFDKPPSHNQLRLAVSKEGLSTYKFTHSSPDKLHYKVREVDLFEDLQRKSPPPTQDMWVVPVTITCTTCNSRYTGWKSLRKDHFDNKHQYLPTHHCPNCPPMSVEEWLAGQAIHTTKPAVVTFPGLRRLPRYKPTLDVTITQDDLEDFI